jgi:hypothetical protein
MALAIFNEFSEVVKEVSFINSYITTHSMALAIFNEFSTLKLLSIGETRFASMLVMLKRTKLLQIALQTMVISSKVSDRLLEDLIRICKEAWNRLKPKYVPLPSAQIPSVPQKRKRVV